MKILCALSFYLMVVFTLTAQPYVVGLATVWDDRLDEWELIYIEDDEEKEIRIQLTWPLQGEWFEWNVTGEDVNGRIKPKWRGDISRWEFRSGTSVVAINQLYRGDLNQWEIRDGENRLVIETVRNGDVRTWRKRRDGDAWLMASAYYDDIRDWAVEDYLSEAYSLEMKTAMVFIAMWLSIPK